MIVVHYQPSTVGAAALRCAIAEAHRRGDTLAVVASGASDHRTAPSYITDQQLEVLRAQLAASGVEHDIERALDDTDPARDVLTRAETLGADLIVTGIRNRSQVGKLILGSNTQRILLEAPCPVLTVPARRPGSRARRTEELSGRAVGTQLSVDTPAHSRGIGS